MGDKLIVWNKVFSIESLDAVWGFYRVTSNDWREREWFEPFCLGSELKIHYVVQTIV